MVDALTAPKSTPPTMLKAAVALWMALPLSLSATTCDITADKAWIREPPPGNAVAAGYVELRNSGAAPLALRAVTSNSFGKIELHESYTTESGAYGMRRLSKIDVPAKGATALKPGGLHLMLFRAKQRPVAGEKHRMQLEFDGGCTLKVRFVVRKPKD
jgi:periplasmic copper chaperone A